MNPGHCRVRGVQLGPHAFLHSHPFAGVYPCGNSGCTEIEPDTAECEALCGAQKFQVSNRKAELVEKQNLQLLEVGGHILRKKRLQVCADTLKGKPAKVRKRDVGRDWHTQ